MDKGDLIDLGFTKGFQQIPSPKACKKTKQPYCNMAYKYKVMHVGEKKNKPLIHI